MSLTGDPLSLAVLAVNTAAGGVLVTAAYDLKDRLVGWISWLGGGLLGGFAGWVVVPELLATQPAATERLAIAAAAALGGAVLGRILIPLAARFAVSFAAFVFSSLAVLALTAGESLLRRFYDPDATGADAVAVDAVVESSLLSQPAFQRALLVALVVGVLAAVLAMRYYDVVITLALVGLGAALVSMTVPPWRALLAGEPVVFAEQAAVSPLAVGIVAALGLAIQYARHSGGGSGSGTGLLG